MEHTYEYAWIIPFVPLPVPLLIGVGLLSFIQNESNLPK